MNQAARHTPHPGGRPSGSSSQEHPRSPWPQGVSRVPTMRISDVLSALKTEFPAITHSKLRFLEEQGFIHPVRTNSGYRQYCAADLERLRYVLTEQRDRYLPLKVIKTQLDDLDSGVLDSDTPLGPRVATKDGFTPAQAMLHHLSDIASAADVDPAFVKELYEAGVLREHIASSTDADRAIFAEHDVEIVRLACALAEFGIDWRHLRSMRAGADRAVTLVDQSVAHLAGKASPSSRAQAANSRAELAELLGRLHTVWLRDGIAELN